VTYEFITLQTIGKKNILINSIFSYPILWIIQLVLGICNSKGLNQDSFKAFTDLYDVFILIKSYSQFDHRKRYLSKTLFLILYTYLKAIRPHGVSTYRYTKLLFSKNWTSNQFLLCQSYSQIPHLSALKRLNSQTSQYSILRRGTKDGMGQYCF